MNKRPGPNKYDNQKGPRASLGSGGEFVGHAGFYRLKNGLVWTDVFSKNTSNVSYICHLWQYIE